MKWQTLLIAAILSIAIAQACKNTYIVGEKVLIIDKVMLGDEGADCNISIYSNVSLINDSMVRSGLVYSYTAQNLSVGVYGAAINCTGNLTGECKFEVKRDTTGDADMMMAIAVILISSVAVLGYFARSSTDEFMKSLLSNVALIMGVGLVWIGYFLSVDMGIADGIQRLIFIIAIIFSMLFTFILFYTVITYMLDRMKQLKDMKMNGR
jgi:hypothetical protein